jgi:hypothetical protein
VTSFGGIAVATGNEIVPDPLARARLVVTGLLQGSDVHERDGVARALGRDIDGA